LEFLDPFLSLGEQSLWRLQRRICRC